MAQKKTTAYTPERIAEQIRNPAVWAHDILGASLWSGCKTMFEMVGRYDRIAVKACHSSSKTWTAAQCIPWWLFTRRPSQVIITAPTQSQIQDQLWKEVRDAWGKLPMHMRNMGICHKKSHNGIEMFGPDGTRNPKHKAHGRSTDEGGRLQGEHGENLFVIIDEASEVPDDIFATADTFMPTKILYIGNPIRPGGTFARTFEDDRRRFALHTIRAEDTPNFTGEEVPKEVAKQLINQQYVEDVIHDFGADSPWVRSRVHAEFPNLDESRVLIPLEWTLQATRRGQTGKVPKPASYAQVGVDVAMGGENRTVMATRVDECLLSVEELRPTPDTLELVRRISEHAQDVRDEYKCPVAVVIDRMSPGAGAHDILVRRSDERIRYVGFSAAESAADSLRFMNVRAEAHWELREMFRPGSAKQKINIVASGPAAERFRQQAGSIEYKYSGQGAVRLQIESKEDMRKRNMPSPDDLDAVVMTFWGSDRVGRPMQFSKKDCAEVRSILADFPRAW